MNLYVDALVILLLNIPFGYWRANTKKFSWQWILSIHIPVPIVIMIRIFTHLGWKLITFPVLISSFFIGQFLGGKLFSYLKGRSNIEPTSCLVMDIFRGFHSK